MGSDPKWTVRSAATPTLQRMVLTVKDPFEVRVLVEVHTAMKHASPGTGEQHPFCWSLFLIDVYVFGGYATKQTPVSVSS